MNVAKAEELLVPNPLLYSDLEKYIWISDSKEEHKNAQILFDYLLKRKIYISGFATDKKILIGLKMYHKTIYNINVLDKEKSVVFFDSYFTELNVKPSVETYSARIVNPRLNGTNVVIWGSGITGGRAYDVLTSCGINVKYFVDSNCRLTGCEKIGKSIFSPDKLEESGCDITIVEALTKWKEVDDSICGKYGKRFYYNLRRPEGYEYEENQMLDLRSYWLVHCFQSNKIYVYGIGSGEREMAQLLRLFDFDFGGFLIDREEQLDQEIDEQCSVKYVEDILYEDDYYIWVYDVRRVGRLKELGFTYFSQYMCRTYAWDMSIGRRNLLDINLGHTYSLDNKYPGIEIYGDESENAYKIAILGNSTTDGTLYPFRSWPEFLSDALQDITIYNCGVCGYTSGQEVIQLIRDALQLKPDMIVVYDGTGDLNVNNKWPFSSYYVEMIYQYAGKHVEDPTNYINGEDGTYYRGIASKGSRFDNWLSNIRTMHAIASDRNIKFISLCAPTLGSKKGRTEKEKSLLLSMISDTLSRHVEESFRKSIEQMHEMPDYMHDLSHIFDGKNDIYMDESHVWEKGNEIIAEEVKKIILPEIGKPI